MRMNWEDGPEEWVDEQLGDPEDERWAQEENEYREEYRDKDARAADADRYEKALEATDAELGSYLRGQHYRNTTSCSCGLDWPCPVTLMVAELNALRKENARLMAIDAAGLHPACMDLQYKQAEEIAEWEAGMGMFRQQLRSALFPFWPNNMGVGGDEIVDAVRRAVERAADWEEREAAICPEDRGFEEVIAELREQLRQDATDAKTVVALYEQNAALKAAMERHSDTHTNCSHVSCIKRRKLESDNAALVAALEEYGWHNTGTIRGCAYLRSWEAGDCDCGFNAALARVRGAE